MKQHQRATVACQIGICKQSRTPGTKPPPRTVGHNGQRERNMISQEAAATILFLYRCDTQWMDY